MKRYKNARDILPESLIQEIQKYVRGQHLYIPQTERKGWGAHSGTRDEMARRNKDIYQKYMDGVGISELSRIYHLSEERIRGIVYENHANPE
ncbi:CD3324 family protein [Paenibacillus hodogayensis]|uniref:CD3324 family protein n=1 Tax=Paenibacillus hodogayensis TaxID=279208 RepID=A0ABV5VV76_9BACL